MRVDSQRRYLSQCHLNLKLATGSLSELRVAVTVTVTVQVDLRVQPDSELMVFFQVGHWHRTPSLKSHFSEAPS